MATTTKRMAKVHVRWMIARDLPAVIEIERLRGGTRTREDFVGLLRDRSTVGMVAECRDRVVGFLVYRLRPDRIEVFDLTVHADEEGKGFGTALLAKAMDKARYHQRACLMLPGGWDVLPHPRWRSDDVRLLLGNVETPTPILADALEEAGCGDTRLLELFRRSGPLAGEIRRFVRWRLLGDDE